MPPMAIARGPAGCQTSMRVVPPRTQTVGVPTAAARCEMPLPLHTHRLAVASKVGSSGSGRPTTISARPDGRAEADFAMSSRSAGPPNTMMSKSCLAIRLRPSSA